MKALLIYGAILSGLGYLFLVDHQATIRLSLPVETEVMASTIESIETPLVDETDEPQDEVVVSDAVSPDQSEGRSDRLYRLARDMERLANQ